MAYIFIFLFLANFLARSESSQIETVKGLIDRLIPQYTSEFILHLHPFSEPEYVIIDSRDSKIFLSGSSGVSLSFAFNTYLSTYLNLSISWTGDNLKIKKINETIKINDKTDSLPLPSFTKIFKKFKETYYLNVCTFSYSLVWWGWERWEREIDFMALRGVNLALAFTGQEKIMEETMLGFGVSRESILNEYFSGAAFLAWQRMGNIRGYGGGLKQSWIDKQFALGKKIIERMRAFGIKTVLPAFNGYVPAELKEKYPNAKITVSPSWNSFPKQYCCEYFLDPTDPLYVEITKKYAENIINAFGSDHFYNGDQFNENDPVDSSVDYLNAASSSMLKGLKNADQKAVWVLQSWLFSYSPFWNENSTRIYNYIGHLPSDSLLILDLYSDVKPVYEKTNMYFGKSFIWSQLHNFGGNMGLYGRMPVVFTAPEKLKIMNNTNLVGLGITMEGINQNTIVYDLLLSLAWENKNITLYSWIQTYLKSRYGILTKNIEKAWFNLAETIYNCNDTERHVPFSFVELRPSLKMESNLYYGPHVLEKSIQLFWQDKSKLIKNEAYRFDIVDLTRQYLADKFTIFYQIHLLPAYYQGNLQQFRESTRYMLSIIKILDKLCDQIPLLRLRSWLDDAVKWADNSSEYSYYIFNAKNQITQWGPRAENNDYAAKHWSGLIISYYFPRWKLFLKKLELSLINQEEFDETQYEKEIFAFEYKWNYDERNDFSFIEENNSLSECDLKEDILECIIDEIFKRFFS